MQIDVTEGGRRTRATTVEAARARGYSDQAIAEAVRAAALEAVARQAEVARAAIAPMSAPKLGIYQRKAAIAADPTIASPQETALLERIAAAQGQTLAEYFAFSLALEAQWRLAGLEMDAAEAEARAAVRAAAGTVETVQIAVAEARVRFTGALKALVDAAAAAAGSGGG